jgi:hypothetical protein
MAFLTPVVLAWIQVAVTVASIIYQRARAKKLAARAREAADQQKGFQIVLEDSASPIPVCYGRNLIGGIRTYHKVASSYVYAAPGGTAEVFTSTGDPRSGFAWTNPTIIGLQAYYFNGVDNQSIDLTLNVPSVTTSTTMTFNAGTGLLIPVDTTVNIRHSGWELKWASVVYVPYKVVSYDNGTGVIVVSNFPQEYEATTVTLAANKTGKKNEFLFSQQVICQAGINKIYWIDVDEKSFDDATFKVGHRIHVYKEGAVADPMATANGIPNTNLFTDCAYLSAVFMLNRDEPQYQGVPAVQVYIEGQKVYGITGSPGSRTLTGSKTYSNNPSLVLLDYLMSTKYGKGLSTSEVDLDSFYDAYLVCERIVESAKPAEGKLWIEKVQTENRDIKLYETNLALDTSKPLRDNIEIILETMPGAELVWSGGKYKLQLIYPTEWDALETYAIDDIVQHPPGTGVATLYRSTAAGNTSTPGVSGTWINDVCAAILTDADIDRSISPSIVWPGANERLNYCTVRYLNESENFNEDSYSWPLKGSALHTTFLTQDSGIPLERETFVTGCTDEYHAQAIAEQMVRSSRNNVVYKFGLLPEYGGLEPGDKIHITSTVLSIPGELMSVEEVTVNENSTITVQAIKFDARQLAWNAKNDEVVLPRNIYDLEVPQATGLAFSPSTQDQTTTSGLLTWVAGNDTRITSYKIFYTTTNILSIGLETVWKLLGEVYGTRFEVPSLITGIYTLAVVSCIGTILAPRQSYATGSKWPTISVSVTSAAGLDGVDGLPGEDAISAVLSNDAHVLPADSLGNVLTYDGAVSTINIYEGDLETTNTWTITKQDVNLVSELVNDTVTIISMSPTGDPDIDYVTLLNHGEDFINYIDDSILVANDVTVGPAGSRFENALQFNGTTSHIEQTDISGYDLGNDDFAIQYQITIDVYPTGNERIFVMGVWGPSTDTTNHSWKITIDNIGRQIFSYSSEADNQDFEIFGPIVPLDTVTQCGVTRNQDTLTIASGILNFLSFSFNKTIRSFTNTSSSGYSISMAIVTGVSRATIVGVGSATGFSTGNADAGNVDAYGSTDGSSTALAVGRATNAQIGTSNGISIVSAVGASTNSSTGSSNGSTIVDGIGNSF